MVKKITRRSFLASSAALALYPSLQPTPPNIVFIMADDLGYGDLGAYGQQLIQTPQLDALAAGSLRFTQCYSPAPICQPCRWSVMTGRHAGNASRLSNDIHPLEQATIADLLRAGGYETGCIGKWSLGDLPCDHGFDYFFGLRIGQDLEDGYPAQLWENDALVATGGAYASNLFRDKAVEFVEQRPEPFFLYAPLSLPHNTRAPDGTLTRNVPIEPAYEVMLWTDEEKAYASMVSRLNRHIDQIVSACPPNTVVFITSDNGWEGDTTPPLFNSSGGLRGAKRDLYEGGIRVPMLAHWPGVIEPGECDYPWWLVDFWATALDIAGLPQVASDGVSVLPALMGYSQPEREYFYWANWGNEGPIEGGASILEEAVRLGDLKVIRIEGQPVEVYDLAADPGETQDISRSHPATITQAERIMAANCGAWPNECEVWLPMMLKN